MDRGFPIAVLSVRQIHLLLMPITGVAVALQLGHSFG